MLLLQLITLTQKTNLSPVHIKQPTQAVRGSSCLPSTSTSKKLDATAASKSQSVATIDLLEKDHIDLPKLIASEREASKKNEFTISKDDVVTSQESTLGLVTSNNVKTDTEETSESSFMNIKITNVVSLPREVFESVPDICDITLHTNTTDTSPPSVNKTLEQLITPVSSKRSMHEGNLWKGKVYISWLYYD